jgi:Integrase core domain/CHC2 zinc finger
MQESDVETILQRAHESFPDAQPRIITDNGPQFIARDFKEFIRIAGMTHVKTSPYYPQSNGKIERWHKTLKSESIRPGVPLSLEEARRIVGNFVQHYNTRRLNSAIGYITPAHMLAGRQQQIFNERNRKLADARQSRARRRAEAQSETSAHPSMPDTSRSIDFAAIRSQLRISDVLDLLGFQSRSVHGSQLRGPCPLHGSTRGTSRCFSVNNDLQVFHCFKCGCHGNALDLWAKTQRLSPYDAAMDLCRRLHLTPAFNAPENRNREEEPVILSLDREPVSDTLENAGANQYSLTPNPESSNSG